MMSHSQVQAFDMGIWWGGAFFSLEFGLKSSEKFLELGCEVGGGPLQVVGISSRE